MGEEEWRVHTVGFPAIDLISAGMFAKPEEVVDRLKVDLSKPIVLFTQHSITTEHQLADEQVRSSLQAMEALAQSGVQIILTYPNNDAGSHAIIEELLAINNRCTKGVQLHRSLGRYLYHGVLALARNPSYRVACVGNSSSGLKETPAFGCPTVNIGSRQQGRLRGKNVIDVNYDKYSIGSAVLRCFDDDEFREVCRKAENPYYLGDAGKKVARVLAEVAINQKLIRKAMTIQGKVKDGWYC